MSPPDTSDARVATIAKITTDPDTWGGKKVTVEGVLVFGDIESRLYKDYTAAEKGWVYDPAGLGIRMSEIRRRFSPSLDGKTVRVSGTVDIGCVLANRAIDAAQADGRLVWFSGFCHTSVGPHLIDATVHQVR